MESVPSALEGMNGSGTGTPIDTGLTQERSALVLNLRRELIALRLKHGADTPIGHRCSNLIGLFHDWEVDDERKQRLEREIARQMADLVAMNAEH